MPRWENIEQFWQLSHYPSVDKLYDPSGSGGRQNGYDHKVYIPESYDWRDLATTLALTLIAQLTLSKGGFICSQCNFTANFESALQMHRELHHGAQTRIPDVEDYINMTTPAVSKDKRKQLPIFEPDANPLDDYCGIKPVKKGLMRTPSASRLLGKLRAKICRSKTLFAHPEENGSNCLNAHEMSVNSSCTSKALRADSTMFRCSAVTAGLGDGSRESYGCHLCDFDADRITVLDRHLLTHHKIGLDNLLQLVMAKTKEGLTEDPLPNEPMFGIRQPYYKPLNDIIEEGEFVIETVMPKIKILKHASTNTDFQWSEIPNLRDNCRMISKELDKLIKHPIDKTDQEQLMEKMQTLNEYMCKFVNSSNMLKSVLNKEFDSIKDSKERSLDEPMFDLGLGDPGTARGWGRAHSETLERNRNKYDDKSAEKSKLSAESYYF